MSARKLIFMAACLLAVLLLLVPVANSLTSSFSAISVKENPQLLRRAEVVRNNRMDYLFFRVRLNDRTIYTTQNFRRNKSKPVDYREQAIWHPNGDSFFLEIAGKRLWGYHVLEKRALSPEELVAVPVTPFDEVGYMGTIEGEEAKVLAFPVFAPRNEAPRPPTNAAPAALEPDVRQYFDFPPENGQ